ncbi:AMP-binding protein [Actinoallomurus sp. NPDC050550]|uniref:AMP-binding protein n=1 Tax=Actinoallomurus sp. NPDC050550 TaxID=3154937 RepID=UPI0033C894D0
METFARVLLDRAGDGGTGLLFEDERHTWADVVRESRHRAALARRILTTGRPPHIGVLLDNVPDYVFWIGGAALSGSVIVGINPTRRGRELAHDIRHTDCQVIVTDTAHAALLDGLDTGVPPERVLRVDEPGHADLLASAEPVPAAEPDPRDPLLLLFTSGSTGAPKAVVCGQGRLAAIARQAPAFGITAGSVTYAAMPLFHGNAVMANLAMATGAGAAVALRRRFSASGFLPDVRRYGVTYFNYVGRALAYILATPRRDDDADNPLEVAFGTEASARDMADFAGRFGCRLIESYGSSEGAISIRKTPDSPPDALGLPPGGTDVAVADPATGEECPPARFGPDGELLNKDEAIGEIVARGVTFEGYYRNPAADAERLRDGVYWSGDLGYRDADGFFYFAGRGGDRLRVDGENFAAAPVERILSRWPPVVMCAVYPVPDPRTGDQVMAALELDGPFAPEAFAEFLAGQADLGTKWAPRFVRVVPAMPLTATNKVDKGPLRRAGWRGGEVWWRPGRQLRYEPLTDHVRRSLQEEAAAHGRHL